MREIDGEKAIGNFPSAFLTSGKTQTQGSAREIFGLHEKAFRSELMGDPREPAHLSFVISCLTKKNPYQRNLLKLKPMLIYVGSRRISYIIYSV
jgi:hypothetical protein